MGKRTASRSRTAELTVLYDVAVFLNSAVPTESLCGVVLEKLSAFTGASEGVVRLIDSSGKQKETIATRGVQKSFFLTEGNCLAVNGCLCSNVVHNGIAVSSDFSVPVTQAMPYACKRDGFQGVVAVPIRSKQRVTGMLNLFFKEPHSLSPSEILLLESVGQHLGIALENRRLVAREKEMAVSEERNILAQELHDSIAQSLAYLNIQVQLQHDDLLHGRTEKALRGLEQIREVVQESYDAVRELLVHFRIRLDSANLEIAVQNVLEKFEGQTGIRVTFSQRGTTPEMPSEHVLQVLHILRESLANIRKHAKASLVDVRLVNDGKCTLSIRDDGIGFEASSADGDGHVGLRVMRERAQRIGAELTLESIVGQGALVRFVLPHRRIPEA